MIGDNILYTRLFADDKVITTGNNENTTYLSYELKEEYEKRGLSINMGKTNVQNNIIEDQK